MEAIRCIQGGPECAVLPGLVWTEAAIRFTAYPV